LIDVGRYRNEIETCQRDTAEYIEYLQSKKKEKVTAIDELVASNAQDWTDFLEVRQVQEGKNDKNLLFVREQIAELEIKSLAKDTEISMLSDTMSRRAKHEAGKIFIYKQTCLKSDLKWNSQFKIIKRNLNYWKNRYWKLK
jgi:hypothetical protein